MTIAQIVSALSDEQTAGVVSMTADEAAAYFGRRRSVKERWMEQML